MTGTRAYFITGTDTEVGKTLISTALLHGLAQRGVRAVGMKPVAAGCVLRDGAWHNDDADNLEAASSVGFHPMLTSPYLLREAVAPHIAAAFENVTIDLAHIHACYDQLASTAEAVVVEGVGGFRVPLSDRFDTADLAQQLGLPVILVVGLRLGCLNHALLTAEAIAARGLTLAGWVANDVDSTMPYIADNVAALSARLPAPLLGAVPWMAVPSAAAAAAYIEFSSLPGWPGAHPVSL
jgi:dethiobiotin synthetase